MGKRKVKGFKKKRETKEEPQKKRAKKKKKMLEGVRGIVRIGEVDLEGDKKIRNALLNVEGIGKSLSRAVPIAASLDPEKLIGSLSDEQIKKIEDVIRNPGNYGIPYHMFNRRFDPKTGENKHLIGSDLRLSVKFDVDLMKKIKCYKGVRHQLGLPVRGQRTRSSFRKGAIVGVLKKKKARSEARRTARSKKIE